MGGGAGGGGAGGAREGVVYVWHPDVGEVAESWQLRHPEGGQAGQLEPGPLLPLAGPVLLGAALGSLGRRVGGALPVHLLLLGGRRAQETGDVLKLAWTSLLVRRSLHLLHLGFLDKSLLATTAPVLEVDGTPGQRRGSEPLAESKGICQGGGCREAGEEVEAAEEERGVTHRGERGGGRVVEVERSAAGPGD